MTARGWTVAIAGSIAAHALTVGALVLSLEPEEAPDQPLPQARMSIEAQQVKRTTATPASSAGEPAAQSSAASLDARQGTIRQTVARAATAPSARLSASTARAPVSAPQTQVAQKVSALPPPAAEPAIPLPSAHLNASAAHAPVSTPQTHVAQKVSALPAPIAEPAIALPSARVSSSVVRTSVSAPQTQVAQKVSALPPPAAEAAIALPSPRLAAVSTPAPTTQSATLADAPKMPALRPATETAAQALPAAFTATDLPLPAHKGKAQLAWSGGGDTAVSATSLAAIAAFTQEGDLADASRQVRDGIQGILEAVPCARLQTTFIPETGALELRGHIPEDALRGPVLAALNAQVGDAIPLSDQLLILPRPQCGALSGIADVGLPQSTEQLTNPRVIGANGFAQNYTYFDGQSLSLDLFGPDYDSYVYVDYFAADGSVIHLQPNDIVPLEFTPAKLPLSVGRERTDGPYLTLSVSAPFGQEIAAAFAASVPLYDGLRPLQEPAAPYLEFLKQQVARARAEHPDFKGEWVYFFISTQAQ